MASTKSMDGFAFSSNSKFFAAASALGEVKIYSLDDYAAIGTVASGAPIALFDFIDQDKSLLVLDRSGKLSQFDMASKSVSTSQPVKGVKLACIDPNHQFLCILTKESLIEIIDLKAGMTFGRIPALPVNQSAVFMGFDRFGQQLALINKTGDAVSWNVINQQLLRQIKLQSGEFANSRSVINSASASSGADHFVIGLQEIFIPQGGMQGRPQPERRNMLISYDWNTGQEYKRVPLRFRTDGMALGTGYAALYSNDSRTISMLNIDRAEVSSSVSIDERPSTLALSDDNNYLAVGSVAGNMYLYEVVRNNPAEIKIVKPSLSRNYGDQVIAESKVNIEGLIEGASSVARILVNGQPVQNVGASFSSEVTLVPGKNRVKIEVENTDRSFTQKDIYLTHEPGAAKPKEANAPKFVGRRLALVIGNANYAQAAKLNNTVNDAKTMEGVLKEMNFEVRTVLNGSYEEMKNAIYTFGDMIKDVDISLFYYAGHGLEVDGTNYLVPVDANIQSALDVKLKAIPLPGILRTMEFTNDEGLNLIILDACRNNPFPTGKRSGGAGLARVQAPSGTLIAYATDPGSTASDGDQANGLYTGELARQMRISQRIEDIFMNTRNHVEKLSNGSQRPWEEARLKGVFYLK